MFTPLQICFRKVEDLINAPSGGGGSDRRVRAIQNRRFFMFLFLACEVSNPMYSTLLSSNLKSFLVYNEPVGGYYQLKTKKQTIIFFFCLGCGVQTGVGLRTLLTHSQQQPTALIYYGEQFFYFCVRVSQINIGFTMLLFI